MVKNKVSDDEGLKATTQAKILLVGAIGLSMVGSCIYDIVTSKDHDRRNLMARIADDRSLHPSYGNNNGSFEIEELVGVCKDLQVALKVGGELPYDLVKRYNEMYSKK
jgi:hypothetical protein